MNTATERTDPGLLQHDDSEQLARETARTTEDISAEISSSAAIDVQNAARSFEQTAARLQHLIGRFTI